MMGSDRDVRRTRLWIGLINGVLVAVLMLGLWSQNFLVQPRFTDWYHIGYPTTDRVVLVAIDDYTIREYGAYQDWSRERYADLLDRLVADGARVVAFDILFSEPRTGDDALEAALANAADNETRVVLAAVGFEPQPAETGNMIQFVDELRPVPAFADLAFYTAFVTTWPDRDGAIRRSPSQVQSGEQTVYNLSIASYLSFLNLSPSIASQVVTPGPASVTLPDQPPLEVAVDAQGLWLINYAGPPSTRDEGTFAVYSIRDVLENTLPPGTFDEKIVLVGLMDAEGAVDQRVTPVSGRGQPMAGVEVHANAIETLLTGIPLREEPRLSQALTIVVLSMVLSVTMARVRWPVMTMLTVALVFVWAVYASVMFSVAGIVLNPLYPIATSLFALLVSVGVRTSLEVRRRRNTESMLKTLQQVSEEQTEFERLLTLIAEDLRLLTDSPEGSVWIPLEDGEFVPVRSWGVHGEYPEISLKAATTGQTQWEGRLLAVPVMWQQLVKGVLTAHFPPVRLMTAEARSRVERFALQIAASMENARLFSETHSQNELLRGVLSESPAGIMVIDDALNIQRYNDRVAEWLEMDGIDFTGQPMSAALEHSPMDRPTWKAIGTNLMQSGQFRQEVTVRNRTYQLDAVHIPLGGRWVLTMSDITDLAELSELKTRMIRIASHDMKNPLGRIIGYAELIQEMIDDGENDPEDYRLYVNRMIRSGEDMTNIITEILDLEHIRSGHIKHEPVDMVNTIRDVLERTRFDADQKNQTLKDTLPEQLPIILGDFSQLVQAFSNLIGNAIKYTPEEGEIQVRLYHDGSNIRFEVQDNGYGIPKDAQTTLFTEFYRVHTERTKHIKGTGLGLSLVKAVIEAHEGRIWVDSDYEQGSTFFVELPVAPVEA